MARFFAVRVRWDRVCPISAVCAQQVAEGVMNEIFGHGAIADEAPDEALQPALFGRIQVCQIDRREARILAITTDI